MNRTRPHRTAPLLLAGALAGLALAAPARSQDDRPRTQGNQSLAAAGQDADRPAAAPANGQAQEDDRRPIQLNEALRRRRAGTNGNFTRRDVAPGQVVLAFDDVSILDTVPFIVEATGKVIMPLNIITLKNKKITVVNDAPIERAEALDLLFRAFRHNGVGVIEKSDVIILDLIENVPRHGDIPVLTADDDISSYTNKGTIIVKVFRLEKANADEVGERLGENLPDFATLTVDVNSNQIVVLGDVGLCQHLQDMIDELDRTFVKVKTQTFRLAHADAAEIEQNILDLFEQDATATQRRTTGRTTRRQPQRPNQPTPSPTTGPGPTAELKVTVNVLQNSVTVSADPAVIDDIERLIAVEWDLPRPAGTSKVYNLKYTDPLKMRDILQELLGQGGGGAGARRTAGRAGGAAQPSDVSQIVGNIYRLEAYPEANALVVLAKTEDSFVYLDNIIDGLDQTSQVGLPMFIELKHADCVSLSEELNTLLQVAGGGATLSMQQRGLGGAEIQEEGFGGTARESDTSESMRFPWQSGRQPEDQSPETALIGKVRIVPIVRQNAVAVLCPLPYRESMKDLIESWDRPGRQVMISAIIAEVELTDEFALGLRVSSGDLTFTSVENLLTGGLTGSGQETGFLDDLFDTSVLDANFDINIALQALNQKTNVRILQEPRVFTADNQEAVFFDGQDIPFISNSNTTDQGGLTQSFEYRQVGVLLNVRPRITVERDVDLEIILELSNVVPGVTLFGGAVIDRRQTSTQVIVRNGQTIVLSGILRDQENEIIRKVPILGYIPLLGELFTSRERGRTTSELVAFITPVVVDNPSENDANFNLRDRDRLKGIAEPIDDRDKIRQDVMERLTERERLQPVQNRPRPSGEE